MLTCPMPEILNEEEQAHLRNHRLPRREWNLIRLHTNRLCHRMEEPDLNK